MGTYLNSGIRSYSVQNVSGEIVNVRPGESVQTYNVLTNTIDDFSLTSAVPYWNPIISRTNKSADGNVALNINTTFVRIENCVGGTYCDVFLQAAANIPAVRIYPGGPPITVKVAGRFTNVYVDVVGASSVDIVQLKGADDEVVVAST